ncbi:MAG: NAD(P)-binding domain-containing protein [Kiloniellales bacterium]
MRIGIIGVGEVGRCFAPVLSQLGSAPLLLCDSHPSRAAEDLARDLGGSLVSCVSEGLAACDLVLSCVNGAAAGEIAQAVAACDAPGQVLLDFATAPPQVKRDAADALRGRGRYYVDIAIMGAISIGGAATPLLAAGDERPEAVQTARDLLRQAGFSLDWLVDATPGDAASLKLLRSVFTKGLEALAVECLVAAEHFGVRHALYEVLSDVDGTPLPAFLEMLVSTHLVHAERRLAEIEQAESQLRDADLPVRLLPSVRGLFGATAAAMAQERLTETPSPDEALRALKAIGMSGKSAARDGSAAGAGNRERAVPR